MLLADTRNMRRMSTRRIDEGPPPPATGWLRAPRIHAADSCEWECATVCRSFPLTRGGTGTCVGPHVLVVADQQAVRVRGERGLARAGQAEEDSHAPWRAASIAEAANDINAEAENDINCRSGE